MTVESHSIIKRSRVENDVSRENQGRVYLHTYFIITRHSLLFLPRIFPLLEPGGLNLIECFPFSFFFFIYLYYLLFERNYVGLPLTMKSRPVMSWRRLPGSLFWWNHSRRSTGSRCIVVPDPDFLVRQKTSRY